MKKWMGLVLGWTALAVQAEVTVSNLVVAQREGTKLVDISYDVASDTTNAVTMTVLLSVSNGTMAVTASSVTGDIGVGVETDVGNKVIVWDAGADWNGNATTLLYTITIDDGIFTAVCPVPKTGQTTSYRTGDDGDLESGTAWPDPRFTNTGPSTVVDNLTGLEWIKAPHSLSGNSETMSWYLAIDFCNALTYAGRDDWRLPTAKEMDSLVHCGKGTWGTQPREWLNSTETPFTGVQSYYWSSTTSVGNVIYAWQISMWDTVVSPRKKNFSSSVWPVRSR